MRRSSPLFASAVLCTAALVTLTAHRPPARPDLTIVPVETPAGPDSAQPQLSVSSRGITLSWIERREKLSVLRFAERTREGWTAPRDVASGTDWFVNWADVPSVVRLNDGTLVAHWLQKSAPDTYAYDVRLSYSTDDGKTWRPSFLPHHDGTRTEHGFASLFQMPDAGLGLAWLDGRAMSGAHSGSGHGGGAMSLRFASYDRRWKQIADVQLDGRVCECCPTAAAMTTEGPVVAYRDRSDGEIRDIYVTRWRGGQWTAPRAVHADGWKVPACPVNGPALSAHGRDVAIAWFNAKDEQPRTFVAFSSDAGDTFGPPVRLDDNASLGRVDVELLPDGAALGAYIEFADQRASFRVRRIERDGSRSPAVVVAGLAGNRTSGYPRLARHGDELVFAWVEREGGSRVRTAIARLK